LRHLRVHQEHRLAEMLIGDVVLVDVIEIGQADEGRFLLQGRLDRRPARHHPVAREPAGIHRFVDRYGCLWHGEVASRCFVRCTTRHTTKLVMPGLVPGIHV
jgi:hypothetical protein